MKTIVLLFLGVFYFTVLTAQNEKPNTKNREIALTVQNINQYGISYKFGNEKALWRLNALQLFNRNQIADNGEEQFISKRMAYAIAFGKEFIKPLSEKFEVRYGAQLSASYNSSSSKRDILALIDEEGESKNITFTPGLTGIVAFHYKLNSIINIGVESTFSVGYDIGKTTTTIGDSLNETTIRGLNLTGGNIVALVVTCKF